jgi:hypothetical protein
MSSASRDNTRARAAAHARQDTGGIVGLAFSDAFLSLPRRLRGDQVDNLYFIPGDKAQTGANYPGGDRSMSFLSEASFYER